MRIIAEKGLHIFCLLAFMSAGAAALAVQEVPAHGQGAEKGAVASDGMLQNAGADIDSAIAQCESLIEKYPASDFTPNVMFQLMELYYRRAAKQYQMQMERYEAELARFENGELKVEPTVPRVSFANVISTGYQIVEEFPTAPFMDKIIYRLAICHQQEGNNDLAEKYFTKLATEYQASPYYDEANFRLGEHFFDRRQYSDAITYYSKLLDSWDSAFFDMALYKLGWAYYNVDNFTKSISTFIFLIDDLSRAEKADNESMGRTHADLRKEAISYIAECFAEFGGARRAEAFLQEEGEKPYSKQIFLKLAEIYQSRNFYDESNDTYAAILRIWPFYEKAPEVQAKIVENYLRMEAGERAEKAREDLVANYGPGSKWLFKYPEGVAREQALKLAEENLYILGTEAQARAQESKDKRDFALAASRYNEYLEKFPDGQYAAKVQFYTAESFYELADYSNAVEAYEKVMLNYPKSEFAPLAAYNRVIATFDLMEAENGSAADTNTFFIEDFLGKGNIYPVRVPNASYELVLQACNDFARFFSADQKLPEVMMKYGEVLFELGNYDLAQEAYIAVVNRGEETPFTLQAYNMIAQCAFQADDFVAAEKWYRRIKDEFADSARYVEKAEKMIASAKFKLAERLKAQEKHDYAALAFKNIAAETKNPEIAERALLQAATEYEKIGKKTEAVIIYENLRFRFPNSGKVDETLFKAATLSEELPDYRRAAGNYLELVKLRPNSVYAPRALFNAALCFENLNEPEKAQETYLQYANRFEDDPDRNLEATCKAGNFAFEMEDYKKASTYYLQVLKNYSKFVEQGKNVDEYSAAEAQFKLAEIYFARYRNVQLTEPIQKSLKKKQTLFEQVLRASQNAAKYKVADWTTAALYRIGAAYEEFGQAFLQAPKPQGLNEEQMKIYEERLQAKIKPLQQKALETYRQNIRMAEENGIQNNWIDKSRERAETLTVHLGFSQTEIPLDASQPVAGKTRINDR